jgi:hypothetical protein
LSVYPVGNDNYGAYARAANRANPRKTRHLLATIGATVGAGLAPRHLRESRRSLFSDSVRKKEETMGLVGLAITFFGFLVAAASVGLSSSNGVRLGIVLAGIVISLIGIIGVINPAYQKNAVWRK